MERLFSRSGAMRQLWWPLGVLATAVGLALVSLVIHHWREPLSVPMSPSRDRRNAPAPPSQATWVSPLSKQCDVQNEALLSRLNDLQRNLPQQMQKVSIDPSNYGERLHRDVYGNTLDPRPAVVVLHETVYGIGSAINTFTTHHPHDDDQVSYHLLIGEKGQVVQTLDPSKRAFGAGYSAFAGRWDITSSNVSGSVNNFALHVSLETPLDGEDDDPAHSGYSSLQYDALAVVLADWMKRYRIPFNHITTHRHIDLGLARADPRSFDWGALQQRLAVLGALC